MGTGGLSRQRLGRMHEVMSGHVERGHVPGLVTLIDRRGEVHVDAIGALAFGGSAPMRRDTIFRIASLTKPITAAAAMILVEECRLRLDDPVDEWLPELAGYGTSAYSDPQEEMIGVLMTQRVWDSPRAPGVLSDFWTSAYQTIDD
jgi:Beta-lactamase